MTKWLQEIGLDIEIAIVGLLLAIGIITIFMLSFPVSKHDEVITYQSVYAIDGNMAILKDENGDKHTVQFNKIFYLQEEEPPFVIVKYHTNFLDKQVILGFTETYLFVYQPKTTITT